MPIQIQCPACEKAFKVKDSFAGKKIRCPKCKKGVIQVPQADAGSGAAAAASTKSTGARKAKQTADSGSAAVTDQAAMKSPDTMWHLKTEDAEIYGPISRTELDEWYAEGRVSADCQIIIDGEAQWKWAHELYPELESGDAAKSPSPFDIAGGGGGGSISVAASGGSVTTSSAAATKTGESDKSKMVAGLLALFVGNLGIHRFYLGYTGLGIAMICCCGGCGIWSLVDAIMIFTDKVKDSDGRTLKP